MAADEAAAPEDVLRDFWTEMHLCEWDAYRTMPSPTLAPYEVTRAHWERFGEEVAAIFARHCTPKTRVYGQGLARSIRSPPVYDPEQTVIVNTVLEAPRRAVVQTERTTAWPAREFYVLLKREGRWLIDNRYSYDGDGKLIRISL